MDLHYRVPVAMGADGRTPVLVPPAPPLGDDVVALRPPDRRDVDVFAAECGRPELAQWLPRLPQPYRREDAVAFVEHTARAWAAGDGATFAIVPAGQAAAVGALGAEPVDRRAGLEIGYWLAPSARGRGLVTHAVGLVCGWAFASGWPRVEALVRPDNAASLAVLARAGFRQEGLLRRALEDRGRVRDVLVLSRLPDDPLP